MTATTRILAVIDLKDEDLAEAYGSAQDYDPDDLYLSLNARLGEVYLGRDNYPAAGAVLALGDFTDVLRDLLDAAEVGAEGLPYAKGAHVLGSIQTMRQYLDAADA